MEKTINDIIREVEEGESEDRSQESISWGELALLTHATQVAGFNWCWCEEQESFPYDGHCSVETICCIENLCDICKEIS
jgi:hypothetical protein